MPLRYPRLQCRTYISGIPASWETPDSPTRGCPGPSSRRACPCHADCSRGGSVAPAPYAVQGIDQHAVVVDELQHVYVGRSRK